MKKVLIYAGTTEGRELAEKLAAASVPCICCVATEYGLVLMREDEKAPAGLIEVRQGRLSAPEMADLEASGDFLAVVDATHPFAVNVTAAILESEKILKEKGIQIPFFRLLRDTGNSLLTDCLTYESAGQCAGALVHTEGKILLTTGSKELSYFCEDEALRSRIIARVLPGRESIEVCYREGLSGSQIIAMQGPFSEEMNLAIFHQYHIRHLVTKQSGRAGGMEDKIAAAKKEGITCHVITKPQEHNKGGMRISEVLHAVLCLADKKESPGIYLIGAGPGNPSLLTREARKVIEKADYIFGAARVIEPFTPRRWKKAMYLPAQILPELSAIRGGTAAILFSGDSGFYSGCSGMLGALKNAGFSAVRVLPGISSVQMLSAKAGIAWQDAGTVSLHGVNPDVWKRDVIQKLRSHEKIFFVTSGAEDVRDLCIFLEGQDMRDAQIVLGYQLSYPEERISRRSVGDMTDFDGKKGLYCGFILRDKRNRILTHSVPDSFFVRGKVPMTKQEVRALCIEKLHLAENSILYDIGSGTGSVAVEAAGLSPSITVYAVEMLDTALDLIHQNKEKAHAFNLHVVPGKAPDALHDLPAPDAAFIGGSGGNLDGILAALYAKNPAMHVVMTAVTLESVSQMSRCMRKFQVKDDEVLQVSVSRAAHLGNYHLMRAENPVYIFSFSYR